MAALSQVDALLEVVGDLYAGALDVEHNLAALHGMKRWLRGSASQVISYKRATGEVLESLTDQSISQQLNDEYVNHWSRIDPRPAALAALPSGKVFRCHELFDANYVAHDRYYQEFFIPAGFRWAVGGALHGEDGVSTIVANLRAPDQPHYSASDALFLRRLMPHVRRAFQIRRKIASHLRASASIDRVVSSMPQPCIVLDRHACVRTFSQAGASVISSLRMSIRGRQLVFDDSTQQSHWAKLMQGVHKTGLPATFAAADQHGALWHLHLLPWRNFGLSKDSLEEGLYLVNLECVRQPAQTCAAQLSERYKLTPAETAVLILLMNGMRVKQIAQERGSSPHTVRDQIASVLSKTGCRSQVELLSIAK